MAFVVKDRVRETTLTTGTGTVTLAGAVIGYQTFSAIGDGNNTFYTIAGQGTSEWEVGIGTYTASGTTLSRDTILASSNSGSAVNFSAGTKDVFVTYPAGKAIFQNNLDSVVVAANTSSDALRITQTGSGNALLVEDSANPDSTPVVIDSGGQLVAGHTSYIPTVAGLAGGIASVLTGSGQIGYTTNRFQNDTTDAKFVFNKARGSVTAPTVVANNDGLGKLWFAGYDGAAYIRGALISGEVDGTPGTNDMPGRLIFSTTADGASTPTERMRITSAGNVLVGRTYTGNEKIGIGGPTNTYSTTTSASSIFDDTTVSSAQTNAFTSFTTYISTQAASFTLANLTHYKASQFTIGAGSIVTNQFGFFVDSSFTGATNNYGFYSNIASGTGRWNFYANGTAQNYFEGLVGLKTTANNGGYLEIGGTANVVSNSGYGVTQYQTIPSTATSQYWLNTTVCSTAAASFTLSDLRHYNAGQGTFGAGSTVTSQYGFFAQSNLTGATNNYGFYSNIASGTGRWNFYANGTASNFFGGNTIISVADNTNAALRITQTGSGNALLVEDSANPDSTPVAINNEGRLIVGYTTAVTNVNTGTPQAQVHTAIASAVWSSLTSFNWSNSTQGGGLNMAKSRSGTIGTQSIVVNGDVIGELGFYGDDGTNFIKAAEVRAQVDGTPGTNDMPGRLLFFTTADGASSPTERMRIDSAGNVGIGGAAIAGCSVQNQKNLTGGTTAFSFRAGTQTVQSDVTGDAIGFATRLTTAAASFTLARMTHYYAGQSPFGAGSTVTNQYGFYVESDLTGATNDYGFYSKIASGTGRWNFYAAGTAENFFGGATTFRAANAIRSEAASTQDAIVIAGRAGGTSSYASTITPATLSANRTVTIPDETFTVGFRNVPAVGTKTGSYTLAVGDVGKYVQLGSGGSITIPTSTFAEGDAVMLYNNTSGSITITCSAPTAYIAGTDTIKTSMTLATRGSATVFFYSATACVVSGNVS